jgi:hypothetical protein
MMIVFLNVVSVPGNTAARVTLYLLCQLQHMRFRRPHGHSPALRPGLCKVGSARRLGPSTILHVDYEFTHYFSKSFTTVSKVPTGCDLNGLSMAISLFERIRHIHYWPVTFPSETHWLKYLLTLLRLQR